MKKDDVILYFGSAAEVARVLSARGWRITPQGVSDWEDEVPKGRAYQIECLTNGDLKAD